MKLTRMDIILMIVVAIISIIFVALVGDKLSNIYLVLIIPIFGFVVGKAFSRLK